MAFKTPEERDKFAELCAAAGGLFLMWAALESELSATLRYVLTRRMRGKQGLVISSAILGSMRMKHSRDAMKRLVTELGYSQRILDFHESFFAQIGHIGDLRDKLAHHMVRPLNGGLSWTVSDLAATRSFSNAKLYEFETESVSFAAHDLADAIVLIEQYFPKGARRSAPQLPSWRYKPSMLKLLTSKKRTSPQAQKRQRGA
jgi:hypothetical protein